MVNQFFIALLAGSGLFLGAILGVIAKDEIKPGIKYLTYLRNGLFSAILLVTMIYYLKINILAGFFILLLSLTLFIKKYQAVFTYLSFSVVYILSYTNDALYTTITSLIFFAGFPIGTLSGYLSVKERKFFIDKRIFIPYFLFITLPLLFSYI
jgi:hypothetical protein